MTLDDVEPALVSLGGVGKGDGAAIGRQGEAALVFVAVAVRRIDGKGGETSVGGAVSDGDGLAVMEGDDLFVAGEVEAVGREQVTPALRAGRQVLIVADDGNFKGTVRFGSTGEAWSLIADKLPLARRLIEERGHGAEAGGR